MYVTSILLVFVSQIVNEKFDLPQDESEFKPKINLKSEHIISARRRGLSPENTAERLSTQQKIKGDKHSFLTNIFIFPFDLVSAEAESPKFIPRINQKSDLIVSSKRQSSKSQLFVLKG